jgi:hypothetical protein
VISASAWQKKVKSENVLALEMICEKHKLMTLSMACCGKFCDEFGGG